ncbi:MAG: type III secretion system chaperone [Planctomycetota bacterium]
MSTLETMEALLTELPPLCPQINLITKPSDETWYINFEDYDVYVHFSELKKTAEFQITIGNTDNHNQTKLLKLFLNYNALWKQTGGVSIALNNDENAVLLFSVPADGLRPGAIANILTSLHRKAEVWRGVIHQSDVQSETAPDDAMQMMNHLRV